MYAALKFRGYDVKFALGEGSHNGDHGEAILPDPLRWPWRNYKLPEKWDANARPRFCLLLFKRVEELAYGERTISAHLHRPHFKLYDVAADLDKVHNLAYDAQHHDELVKLQKKLYNFRMRAYDPWIFKLEHD